MNLSRQKIEDFNHYTENFIDSCKLQQVIIEKLEGFIKKLEFICECLDNFDDIWLMNMIFGDETAFYSS